VKKQGIIILVLVLLLLGAGCGAVLLAQSRGDLQEQTAEANGEVKTFADWTTTKIFQDVPAMIVKHGKIGEVSKDGGSCYFVDVNGSTVADYQDYLKLLEQEGYKKYVDNGEEGLNGNVFSSVYTKDELVLTIIHMEKLDKTYIAAEEVPLSDHLFYSEDYVKDNKEGAETTLHMLELNASGNSFVIQMKNGHFLVMDGGNKKDAEYLLNYLESLVPKGEKPVVEGWLISHSHHDHVGVFKQMVEVPGFTDRVICDGIYMDWMNAELTGEYNISDMVASVRDAAREMKTQNGENTPVYRPHAGQRLYFNDIVVEVMQTMIQVPAENYYYGWAGNYNETSTWLMFHIDEQKFLHAGDADFGAMKTIMETYDQEYMKMNIMAVQHHGINVHNEFSDFVEVDTLLYPYYYNVGHFKDGVTWGGDFQISIDRNEYFHTLVEETLTYGDGGKVLTFPYTIGSYKNIPLRPDRASSENSDQKDYLIPY